MPRANQNLSKEEAAILRGIAAYHGLTAVSGPHAGQGSALALQQSIIAGDVQIVALDPDELALVAPWLQQQADELSDGALRDALLGIVYGLSRTLLPAPRPHDPSPDGGPIDTLEG